LNKRLISAIITNMPLSLIILLAVASIVRLWLAMLFPITADESYYWLWSKHLSLSYVDHPPMVAYINFLTTFGRENLLALRLGATAITLLVSLLIYYIAKEAFSERVAFWSALLFQIIPHFLIIWLTMFVELPLALFWTASLLIIIKIVKSKQSFWWYWLTIILGLGYLSKYTMFLFWPCLLLFLIVSEKNRFWLRRKEPYVTLIISLLFFAPVLYWNSQHQWISFTFHSAKLTSDPFGAHVLSFVADQLVHFTPFLLFTLYGISKFSLKRDDLSKALFCFSVPILLLFLLLSLKVKIWAHWPSVGYVGLLPLAIAYLMENGKGWKKFLTWISIFTLMVIAILFWVSPGIMLSQKNYPKNYKLADLIPPGEKIFARTYVSASLLEFYTRRQTYLATGFLKFGWPWGEKQYEIWGIPNLKRGENILYYGEDSETFRKKASAYFEKITDFPELHLYLIEDYITKNYHGFKLEGYKGGAAHP